MQPKMKIAVAVLAVALVAVIGLIVVTNRSGANEPAPAATAIPEETAVPEETAEPEQPDAAAEQAQGEEEAAQETMYEGALAGLSEEEIAKLALAEEESGERQSDSGAEDSVD